MTDVAVVIGNYQGASHLPECIESLHRQSHTPVEIVVADAGSRDDSVQIAERLGARVLRLENRGLGALYNAGLAASAAPYVLLSNNDVSYADDCVALLAAALDADPCRFGADGQQFDWDGERVVKARTVLSRGRLLHEYIPGFHLEHAVAAADVVPTLAVHAGSMLVRRDLFVQLGGFDETFFLDAEDLDLSWRAWLRGWASVYVPAAQLRHKVGGTGLKGKAMTHRLASSHHNMLRFALKCLPPGAVARILLGEAARLPRHPRVIGKALLQVAAELPEIARLRRATRPQRELLEWMLQGQPTS